MKKTIIKMLSVMVAVVLTITAAPLSGFVGLELPEWLDFSIEVSAEDVTADCDDELIDDPIDEPVDDPIDAPVDEPINGTFGDNLSWNYDKETCTLTISGEGGMSSTIYPWDDYSDEIKIVIIENGVTSIGMNAFYWCESLTSVTIPDSVTYIGEEAFSHCESLTSVVFGNGVTTIRNFAFSSCYCLTNIVIPDSVTEIGDSAFCWCESLTSVVIGKGVTMIDEFAFAECYNLQSITVDSDNQYYSNDEDGVLFNKDKTELIQYPIGNIRTNYTIPDGVTSIVTGAFYGDSKLINITIPDSVISIGYGAFIDTGYYNDSDNWENGVLYIDSYLIEAEVQTPDYLIKEGTRVIADCAFDPSMDILASITIPDSVITIGYGAFWGCSNLTSITIADSVTRIGKEAFEYTGYYEDGNNWENGVLYIDNYLIEAEVQTPDYQIKEGTKIIAGGAFIPSGDILTNITIPDSVITIDQEAFFDCIYLNNVVIPDGVTKIDYCVFAGCESLTSVTIPDSVTSIDKYAFYNCKGLTDVYYSGTEEEWNEILISTSNEPLLNATIHFNYCEHDYVDGTCTDCAKNKPITQEMSSQIRFDRNADNSYAGTFAVRTRAMISDETFKELVGATNEEAANNIDKIGFVYTVDGENFSVTSAQAVAQGEKVAGYTDAPVSYVQDADGYYMFTCLVTDIPDNDKNYTLSAYAYVCVNGKWYFSEEPMTADFSSLYSKYYPIACEKYGW